MATLTLSTTLMHDLHHLFHPVKLLWTERVVLFWPIWLGITALGLLIVMRVMPWQSEISAVSTPSSRLKWSRRSVLALILLGLFLGCYVAGLLVWEDFTYYDNSHFTNETLIGRNVSLQISPEEGRFWPLGHQEFSLLRHIKLNRRLSLPANCSIGTDMLDSPGA